jgi:hypothetical protein
MGLDPHMTQAVAARLLEFPHAAATTGAATAMPGWKAFLRKEIE